MNLSISEALAIFGNKSVRNRKSMAIQYNITVHNTGNNDRFELAQSNCELFFSFEMTARSNSLPSSERSLCKPLHQDSKTNQFWNNVPLMNL